MDIAQRFVSKPSWDDWRLFRWFKKHEMLLMVWTWTWGGMTWRFELFNWFNLLYLLWLVGWGIRSGLAQPQLRW